VDVRAFAADDHAGTRGVHVHADLVAGTLDLNLGDRGLRKGFLHVAAHLQVLMQELREIRLSCIPTRAPGLDVTEPETYRMYFLAHYLAPAIFLFKTFFSFFSAAGGAACFTFGSFAAVFGNTTEGFFARSSSSWMWLVRFLMRLARPIVAARKR